MAGRQWLAVLAAALIGGGAASLVASCGEDDGDVQIEGSSTGSTGSTGTGTTGTGTGTGTVTVATSACPKDSVSSRVMSRAAVARESSPLT